MSISSPGIGANLDVNSIVSQLLTIDKQPIAQLDAKTASFQAKLSGFGTLKGLLSQFQTTLKGLSDISKFQGIKTSIADTSIATASGSALATPGTYSLEVSKLAQAQKLNAAGQASATAAIGGGGTTTLSFDFGTVSGGTFNATTGTYGGAGFASNGNGAKQVTIDGTNNSLAGIRDAINKAGVGVTATIVNDGSGTPYRLSLSGAATGSANSLKLSVAPGGDPALTALLSNDPAGSQALQQTSAAQNAEFTLDGIAVSKSTNTVTDAVPGVTLTLAKTNVGSPTNVSVARDATAVTASVNTFVKSFNDINQALKEAGSYNAATKTGSILNGESSVRVISTQIRSALAAPVAGGASTFSLLSQIGVTVQKDGSLGTDSAKLQTAISTNFDDIAGLFGAVGKSTDALISVTGSTAKTVPGAYDLVITQLAARGFTTGTALAMPTVIDASNNALTVKLDGVSATVTLAEGTYATLSDLASEVQSKINGATGLSSASRSIVATQSGGKLTLTSASYGAASAVEIIGGSAQALLGFGASAVVMVGKNVAGTINGVAGTGAGQTLVGATGDASEGLSLLVSGGAAASPRGVVNFNKGYAYQLSKIAETLLAADGPIASRTNGINSSIKDVARSKDVLTARLAGVEKRYRAQFTALDSVISKMSTTSTFLTQQLANLPKI